MADATHSLIIEALNRAAADPGGMPLFSSKGTAGLFAGTAAARQAAQLCKDQGLLHVARTETRGKSQLEISVGGECHFELDAAVNRRSVEREDARLRSFAKR